MAMVLHHSSAKGTAKVVLLGIANHEGDGGAFPAVATLAKYARVDERSVQRAIAQLVSRGELTVEAQAGGFARTPDHERPNLYRVTVSCPVWCDRTTNHRDTRQRLAPLTINYPQPVDNRVTKTSPGDASVTPPGDASVTRTVHVTQPPQGPALTTDRAGAVEWDDRLCTECSKRESLCYLSNQNTPPADRHAYSPGRRPPR